MFDNALINQLRSHFSQMKSEITLRMSKSAHPKQAELYDMLRGTAEAGEKIILEQTEDATDMPSFEILKNGAPLGIRFFGVPGGHEFSSLILAILNADGQGKLPDDATAARIRALKRPIHLRTFVSLSCTNCPDAVQALNQAAILSDGISHDIIDGDLFARETARLGIQGVPSVFENDDLLHSGRAGLGELLDVLEKHAGTSARPTGEAKVSPLYDVLVLGGGPAGVTAAIYSARKGLNTALVAERIGGQVNDTLGIENLISVPYTEGPALSASLTGHLKKYPAVLYENRRIVSVQDKGEEKHATLKGGEVLRGLTLIVAAGAKWRELNVPGEKEYIGRGVAFCPHCDGPFFKGRRTAVVGGGNSGIEAAIDLAGICKEVTVLEFADELKADKVLIDKLIGLPNTKVALGARTTKVLGDGKKVTGIQWEDRASGEIKEQSLDGIFVQIGLAPNSDIVKDLVKTNSMGEIVTDAVGRTDVESVYAAGDVTAGPYKQIVIAMGQGASAALAAFEDRMRRPG